MLILELCFLLIDWLSFGEKGGVRLKLDVQGQGCGRIVDVNGQGGGGFESWTIHGCHMYIIPNKKPCE